MIYLVAWTGGVDNEIPTFEFFKDLESAQDRFDEFYQEFIRQEDGSYLHLISVDPATQQVEIVREA